MSRGDPTTAACDGSTPSRRRRKYSLSVPLTFTFPTHQFADGQDVIWTVQFNTSHGGYAPIVSTLGSQACNALEQGLRI